MVSNASNVCSFGLTWFHLWPHPPLHVPGPALRFMHLAPPSTSCTWPHPPLHAPGPTFHFMHLAPPSASCTWPCPNSTEIKNKTLPPYSQRPACPSLTSLPHSSSIRPSTTSFWSMTQHLKSTFSSPFSSSLSASFSFPPSLLSSPPSSPPKQNREKDCWTSLSGMRVG